MSKWKCHKIGCFSDCESNLDSTFTPIRCLCFDNKTPNWELVQNEPEQKQENTLPDWCKNGALAWENGDYFELEVIDEDHQITMKYSNGTEESVIADYIGKHVKQARLRPFNADEMKALVGKVIEHKKDLHLVTNYLNDTADNEPVVCVGTNWRDAKGLIEHNYTIEGNPCGVLEHLDDNGEWVE